MSMKKGSIMMKRFLFLLFIIQQVDGTVLVQGNAATALTQPNPNANILTFSQPVNAKSFDRTNGIFYVGLANNPASSATTAPITIAAANQWAISKIVRASGNIPPSFVPIATNTTLFPQPSGIDFLSLATSAGNKSPVVVSVLSNASAYLQNPNVVATSSNGSIAQGYSSIRSYDPNISENGPTSGGIVQLAANQNFIFAAVRPPVNTTTSPATPIDFGNTTPPYSPYLYGAYLNPIYANFMPGSGIAVLGLNPSNLLLTQVPAQPNDPGIKAAELDQTTPQVVIQGTTMSAVPLFVPNRVSLFWDDPLQRLYIGLQLATAASGAGAEGDGARSVVVSTVSPEGTLIYNSFFRTVRCQLPPQMGNKYI